MREIEFRGKRKFGKKKGWVYGNLRIIGDYVGIETPSINPEDEIDVEVDSETIGQYTGLKDKNGVKIFEGDIMYNTTWGGYPNFFVRWAGEDEYCGWTLAHTNDEIGELFLAKNFTNCEVIGNIYDNPELLEKEIK